ncbi:hypothetical protein NM04_20705 [Massilia aurea]|uniref:Uncharacterized protein n=1 Tax=Massilia aurea TaxID=373040 RepID=A0A422QG28_9BURK|nr:hypothetical protein [Massilia aurea]RNF28909.1 hypothetical protein NM04_20705 [Massilia aurea]
MNKKLVTLLFAIGLGASTSVFAWQDNQCLAGCGQILDACQRASTNAAESAKCWEDLRSCNDRCGL